MDQAFKIQKQARDNVKSYQTYMTDLKNWETEMKRKEAALNGEFEQELPPVRSKIKKEKPTVITKKIEKRISSSDYNSWEKFDVDKACEEVDMAEVGPSSLDARRSVDAKQEKLREEALYEKERGNNFVKNEKWDEAISCYNRAIELVKDDAIYYANRGLCHLKKESLHLAESDCTAALKLDPTYVKAYQRRAAAREKLGSLRSASQDLGVVIQLEPQNTAAKKQLHTIKIRMGTKGSKSKSSPVSTPTVESKSITANAQPKIIELEDHPPPSPTANLTPLKTKMLSENKGAAWEDGSGENVTVIKPVKKPPHLRSKRPLKVIPIEEIPLGETSPIKREAPPTRLKIVEITDDGGQGDTKVQPIIDNSKGDNVKPKIESGDFKPEDSNKINNSNALIIDKDVSVKVASPESEKFNTDLVTKENNNNLVNVDSLVPPATSVQFMAEWKYLKDKGDARCAYLSIVDPARIPAIFHNALESDVVAEVLQILHDNMDRFKDKRISAYLKGLVKVKRFSALAMFLSGNDKLVLGNLLEHCRSVEGCPEEDIADLKKKFEL